MVKSCWPSADIGLELWRIVADGAHEFEHLFGWRKVAHGSRQIAVCALFAADDPRDGGQYMAKIDAVARADKAARLAEIENPQLPAGLEHAKKLTKPGFVVHQVAKAECGDDQVVRCGPQRQVQRIGLDGNGVRVGGDSS